MRVRVAVAFVVDNHFHGQVMLHEMFKGRTNAPTQFAVPAVSSRSAGRAKTICLANCVRSSFMVPSFFRSACSAAFQSALPEDHFSPERSERSSSLRTYSPDMSCAFAVKSNCLPVLSWCLRVTIQVGGKPDGRTAPVWWKRFPPRANAMAICIPPFSASQSAIIFPQEKMYIASAFAYASSDFASESNFENLLRISDKISR